MHRFHERLVTKTRGAAVCLVLALLAPVLTGCGRHVVASPEADHQAARELRKKLLAAKAETAEAAEDTAAPVATGWSTLSGRFTFAGTAPPRPAIKVDKDTEVCGVHPLLDESVIVSSDGGLQNAVLFLRTTKPPVHPDYQASAAAKIVLDNRECRFEPHVEILRTSQMLLVKNSDPVGHNSNFQSNRNGSPNTSIPAADAREQKFPKAEPNPIKIGCNIHPWMGAWLIVRSDPYAAVSDASGRFKIEKLPAGKPLEFQLWQEKAAFLKGVELAGAPGLKVDGKGRFKVTLKADEPLELEIRVPAEAIR